MFFEESRLLEQSCKRVNKETFLPSYNELGPVVSDKKIFLNFSIQISRENKSRPLAAMFFDDSKWLEQSW